MTEQTKIEEIEPITWGAAWEKVFRGIKGALALTSALGLPDYTKTFSLYIHERKGVGSGVLMQKSGPHQRPMAWYFVQPDPVADGAPTCVSSVAAAATIVAKCRSLLLELTIMIYVPHEAELLLKQYAK